MIMVGKTLIFVCFFGAAIAILHHPDENLHRTRRYAPARNDPHLLQDTLVPIHYDLTIKPDIYKTSEILFSFEGNVTIHFKCVRYTNTIRLHAMYLFLLESDIRVMGGDQPISVTSIDKDEQNGFVDFNLDQRLSKGEEYKISITFGGGLVNWDFYGLYYSTYKVNGKPHYMAITQMETHYARRVFPCFDEPALKATFSITVLRKDSHVALSNMPLIKTEPLSDGWFADTFDKTPMMPTYLVAIAVTDFEYNEGYTKDGIQVRVWWQKDNLNDTEFALDTAIKSTEWFTEYTGINYTLPKMDHIAVPDFEAGGMENWGLITYDVSCLIFSKEDSYSTWDRVSTVVIHEVAHQWFGNLVTAKWWNEIWINEALTSYSATRCKEVIVPEADVINEHLNTRQDAFGEDKYHTAHPVDISVVKQTELMAIFDRITYSKGSLILTMLQHVIGDKTFRRGIRTFLQTHLFGNADQYDLYDAFNEALTYSEDERLQMVDVGQFMATWIQQAGFPVITILHDENGLRLNQSRFLVDPDDDDTEIPDRFKSPFGGVWEIPLFISTNATGKSVETPPVWMRDTKIQLSSEPEFTNFSDTTWILGNQGLKGYYIINYDQRNWGLLAEQLKKDHTVIPTINRAQMIIDSSLLIRSGRLHLTESMELMSYLRKEKDLNPWKAFFKHADDSAEILKYTKNYPLFRTYMLDLLGHMYNDKLWEVTAGLIRKDPQRVLDSFILRETCHYDYAPCLKKAKEIYKNARAKSWELPADIRQTVFCSVVKTGKQAVWDEVYAFYLNRYEAKGGWADPFVRDLIVALSCSSNQKVLRTYLERELIRPGNSYKVKSVVFKSVAKMNAAGGQVVLDVLLKNWTQTQHLFESVYETIAESLHTKLDIKKINAFLAKNPEAEEGWFDIYFWDAKETIKANMKWLKKDGQRVIEWLREVYKGKKQNKKN